jgi:hypothetical protein
MTRDGTSIRREPTERDYNIQVLKKQCTFPYPVAGYLRYCFFGMSYG